jgi:hypothetical protein
VSAINVDIDWLHLCEEMNRKLKVSYNSHRKTVNFREKKWKISKSFKTVKANKI